MGLFIHFYIIFGTNLLTQSPVQIAILFFDYQCFAEKEYQTESKQNETFGNVIFGTNVIQRTWSGHQATDEEATRQGAPTPLGAPSTLMGPLWLRRPTSSSYIYRHTPKTSETEQKPYFHRHNLLYPWDPILEPFPVLCWRGNRSRRASTSSSRPLWWVVSSLPQTFGSIVIS